MKVRIKEKINLVFLRKLCRFCLLSLSCLKN